MKDKYDDCNVKSREENDELIDLTPVRAIRAKCLDCCAFSSKEVKLCRSYSCPLWQYRLGKNPRILPMSEERKQQLANNLEKFRKQIDD